MLNLVTGALLEDGAAIGGFLFIQLTGSLV